MKKILALALVLVLALGMMVPAAAAAKGKVVGVDLVDESTAIDLRPDEKIELTYSISDFFINDDAVDALNAAMVSDAKRTDGKTPAYDAAIDKLIKTIEPRFAVRKGGQIFKSIDIDNITAPKIAIVESRILSAVKKVVLDGINLSPDASKAQKVAATTKVQGMTYKNMGNGTTDLVSWLDTVALIDATKGFTDAADIKKAATDAYAAALLDEQLSFGADWVFDVVLETVFPFVSVSKVDYEVDIYFLLDNKRTDNVYKHTIYGEFGNEVTTVDNDTYDADSYKGQVIEAEEYVGKIAICGNYEYDINANVKMAKDKKIYFYVTTESEIADEPIFDKYPAIDVAFKVYQVGLNSYTGNFISLNGVDSTYYIYGKDANGSLKYLGRGGELVPLSAKYYISTAKLDISDSSSIDEDLPTDPVPEDNFNPSTGI